MFNDLLGLGEVFLIGLGLVLGLGLRVEPECGHEAREADDLMTS